MHACLPPAMTKRWSAISRAAISLAACLATGSAHRADDPKVKLKLLTGPGCKPCRVQVEGPLKHLFEADGIADIVDFKHNPFGNSYFETKACGGGPYEKPTRACWAKTCVDTKDKPPDDCFSGAIVYQHGEEEGKAIRMQACAIAAAGTSKWLDYWSFLVCAEAKYDEGEKAAQPCAKESGLDYGKISKCYKGKEGDAAVKSWAKQTSSHLGTPMLWINGEFFNLEDDTGRPLPDEKVLNAVCEAYTGKKPPGCSQKGEESCASASAEKDKAKAKHKPMAFEDEDKQKGSEQWAPSLVLACLPPTRPASRVSQFQRRSVPSRCS
eukprot:TRINITY_DN31716_c0_g1_i2.p1 TRINITY_DN31716_c0_g1~~TRINITY_DN31716_c0_g1_i2.p1  ORF type:complete len:324 (-),score=46.44 TRINITY_DN31716_c0_g1_i2:320-1291(-)